MKVEDNFSAWLKWSLILKHIQVYYKIMVGKKKSQFGKLKLKGCDPKGLNHDEQ